MAQDTLNLVIFKLGRSLRGEALEKVGFFHLGRTGFEICARYIYAFFHVAIAHVLLGSLTTAEASDEFYVQA